MLETFDDIKVGNNNTSKVPLPTLRVLAQNGQSFTHFEHERNIKA